MTPRVSSGDRLPQVSLGRLVNGAVEHVWLQQLLAGKRAVIVGVPGAFTPVCTCEHIPDLLANVGRLRAAGLDYIICVAPNDPWVMEAWAERVDPDGRLTFLSDGNLALARALGVNILNQDNLLGETSARYMLIAAGGIVHRLNVESHINDLTCTRAQDIELID